MKVGYVRLSRNHPDETFQLNVLTEMGCQQVFVDKRCKTGEEHPGLEVVLDYLQAGDMLVVWRLDCVGRTLKHLVAVVNQLAERGIELQSLEESFDTSADEGRAVFDTFAILEKFQKQVAREPMLAGLKAARARGRKGGRPRALDTEQTERLFQLYDAQQLPVQEICEIMRISKPTLYTYLKQRKNGVTSFQR